ncbi:MAG: YraN family protein [Patescibacteria group bacterium]
MSTSELGRLAENLAEEFLKKRGFSILDRNFRKPWGEIDIVAKDKDVIAFIEVKANREDLPGFEPELRAGNTKLHKVVRTAKTYLSSKHIGLETEWRVDVITVVFNKTRRTAKIKHFPNVEVA